MPLSNDMRSRRSCERINGFKAILFGHLAMASQLAEFEELEQKSHDLVEAMLDKFMGEHADDAAASNVHLLNGEVSEVIPAKDWVPNCATMLRLSSAPPNFDDANTETSRIPISPPTP